MTASSRFWIKPALIGAAVLALAGLGYASLGAGVAAPNVTFMAINGDRISSESLRGKVVMVNFWATSCATCIKEMPDMVKTYAKFKDQGLEFVAVAMKGDPPNYVLNFVETRQLPFKIALDLGGDLAKAYGDVSMTPTTFVISKDGKILKRYVGEPKFDELHALLQKALAS
jgi:peroxiredoxin